MLGTLLISSAIGGLTYFALRSRGRRRRRKPKPEIVPQPVEPESPESPVEPIEPPPGPGPAPTISEAWHPGLEEVSWSDQLYISPDFQEIRQGGVWATETKHPRVVAEAKAAGPGNVGDADTVLSALVADASPEAAEAGYELWGPSMQQWYDHSIEQIEVDLLIYAQNPNFLS